MKHPIYLLSAVVILNSCSDKPGKKDEGLSGKTEIQYNKDLLDSVRAAATTTSGELPTSIGYIKYAESIRKWSDLVEGGGN